MPLPELGPKRGEIRGEGKIHYNIGTPARICRCAGACMFELRCASTPVRAWSKCMPRRRRRSRGRGGKPPRQLAGRARL